MKHYFVVPAIHLENTSSFLASLGNDIALERVILIDNTPDGVIADRLADIVAHSVTNNHNAGVGPSWNTGAQLALAQGAEFVTLTSTSMRLQPDGGAALCRTADLAAENGQWPYGFESMNGWHLITLGRRTFDEVGYFDEEFAPAYYEDNDFIYRMRLAGILDTGDRSKRKIPWIGALRYRCVQDGHAIANGVKVDLEKNAAYYAKKWGGLPGEEKFTTPFGFVEGGLIPRFGGMSFTESM